MASSITQFRQHVYRDLTLPSGLTVTARRKPDVSIFLGLGELPMPSNGEAQAEGAVAAEHLISVHRYTNRAIAATVVEPPMTDATGEDGKPVLHATALHVTELDPDDYAFLAQEILRDMGLLRETATDVDSFRPDEERAPGAVAGAGVRSAAE